MQACCHHATVSNTNAASDISDAAVQSFVVAVVIPEKKEIQSFAKQAGIDGEYSEILQNDKVTCHGPLAAYAHCR